MCDITLAPAAQRGWTWPVMVHAKALTWEVLQTTYSDIRVSWNRSTPKSSILIGFFIINHPFWGTPIDGNPHIATKPCKAIVLHGDPRLWPSFWYFVSLARHARQFQSWQGAKLEMKYGSDACCPFLLVEATSAWPMKYLELHSKHTKMQRSTPPQAKFQFTNIDLSHRQVWRNSLKTGAQKQPLSAQWLMQMSPRRARRLEFECHIRSTKETLGVPEMTLSQNGWFVMENPIEIDARPCWTQMSGRVSLAIACSS